MAKTTCQNCDRTVVLVDIGDRQVMLDTEIISVVPAIASCSGSGGVRMSTRTTPARRLHAELCDAYQAQAQRVKIAAEQRAYNRKNGRGTPVPAGRKNRGL